MKLFYVSTEFLCHMKMGWYPFDKQHCTIEVGIGKDDMFVELVAEALVFSGEFFGQGIIINSVISHFISSGVSKTVIYYCLRTPVKQHKAFLIQFHSILLRFAYRYIF